jgi:hypothetical protein
MCVPFATLLALLGCVLATTSLNSNMVCSPQGGQFDQRRSTHDQFCIVALFVAYGGAAQPCRLAAVYLSNVAQVALKTWCCMLLHLVRFALKLVTTWMALFESESARCIVEVSWLIFLFSLFMLFFKDKCLPLHGATARCRARGVTHRRMLWLDLNG